MSKPVTIAPRGKQSSRRVVPAVAWRTIMCLLAIAVAPLKAYAQTGGPRSRAEAVEIIAGLRGIVAPNGIERREKVRIGGIDQWVSIRGRNRNNPVLLFLHGGPGFVSMPSSWYANQGWDEYFTVIQWDQRGAGKTYADNNPAVIAPTMTVDRMVADTEEMVQWARRSFGKQRIVVAGVSWGTVLGLQVARRHPDWVSVYVGMSQLTDGLASEREGWRWTLDRAKAEGNADAVRELGALAPYAARSPVPLTAIKTQRKWLQRFGGEKFGRRGLGVETAAYQLSPDYDDRELAAIWKANAFSESHLLDKVLTVDFSNVRSIDVPVILMAGRADHVISGNVAERWLANLRAPSKRFLWFEQSGHDMFVDEPGKTLVELVTYVLPLAKQREVS